MLLVCLCMVCLFLFGGGVLVCADINVSLSMCC